MKKIFYLIAAAATMALAAGCYDDSSVNQRIDILEDRVAALEQMNSDIESIQTIVEGLQSNITITNVIPTANGYKIFFSDGKNIEIKNGEKGDTGTGTPGAAGATGPQGPKGDTPVISVGVDNGAYYWMVGGQFILDAQGNKVPVTGTAPKLKIESNKWMVSYDNGATWSVLAEITEGTATSFFSNVDVKESEVTFTLSGGQTITLPLGNGFTLSIAEDIPCLGGATVGVPYVITGAENPTIYCLVDGGYTSKVEAETATKGKIVITAPKEAGNGQVLVFASNGIKTLVKQISLSKGVLVVKDSYTVAPEGGTLEIDVQTNLAYEATTEESWITINSTKAEIRNEKISVTVSENPQGNPERSGEVKLVGLDGSLIKGIIINQGGDGSVIITKTIIAPYYSSVINPSDLAGYAESTVTAKDDWITVDPDTKALTIAENSGLVRLGTVQYGSKFLRVLQNPGKANIDFYFDNADGKLEMKNLKVLNWGTDSKLATGPTVNFYAFDASDGAYTSKQPYSQAPEVSFDDTVGHKVLRIGNLLSPSSYGSILWRNANGTTITAMQNGYTVEMLLAFNLSRFTAGDNAEANAFCFKSHSKNKTGYKAISVGMVYDKEAKKNVFRFHIDNSRIAKATTDIQDQVYYHVVAVYNATDKTNTIYIDGVKEGQTAEDRDMTTLLTTGTNTNYWNLFGANVCNPWILGGYLNGEWNVPNSCWNGKIAICRVYATSLSAEDIAKSYAVIKSTLKTE